MSSTLCCGRSVALVAQSCENSNDFVTKVLFIIYAFDVITTIALLSRVCHHVESSKASD